MTGNGPPKAALYRRRREACLSEPTASLLHSLTPAGPHTRHWLHLLYRKLYYVSILMAAAFLGVRGTFATALVVSFIFFAHILRDWSGDLMRQAEQVGEIASFWVIAVASPLPSPRAPRP